MSPTRSGTSSGAPRRTVAVQPHPAWAARDADQPTRARPSPNRSELAATLRRLRQDAGLSGIEAVKEVTALCKAYRHMLRYALHCRSPPGPAGRHYLCSDRAPAATGNAGTHWAQRAVLRANPQFPAGHGHRLGADPRLRASNDVRKGQRPDAGAAHPVPRERQAVLGTDRQFILLHAGGALRWHTGGTSGAVVVIEVYPRRAL